MKTVGKNQKDFADELCIAQATLSAIFKGTTKPSTNIVNSIHERFPEVSIGWLMFGEGNMYVTDATLPPPAPTDDAATRAPTADLPLFASIPTAASAPSATPLPKTDTAAVVKNVDKPERRITEIRVFYDNGTFEIFKA